MKAPRYFAGLVCLFFAFAYFEGVMWHWRPEPGWHPSWWQIHSLAWFGFYVLGVLSVIPTAVVGSIFEIESHTISWLAFTFGILLEFALIYSAAFVMADAVVKFFRRHEKVA